MFICENSTNKTYELWLTRDEQSDACTRAQMLTIILRAKAQGLLPVILCSGHGSLTTNTKELIKQNRSILADDGCMQTTPAPCLSATQK